MINLFYFQNVTGGFNWFIVFNRHWFSRIYEAEVKVNSYSIFRFDQSRHSGGVACYIWNYLIYDIQNIWLNDTKKFFCTTAVPKFETLNTGIIYRSPDQNNFFAVLIKSFTCLDTSSKTFIRGDFSINLLYNGECPIKEVLFNSMPIITQKNSVHLLTNYWFSDSNNKFILHKHRS